MPADWISYHLFYHGDRDLVLRCFVRPAVGTLWTDRLVDSFFFIFYRFGGPHFRLRVRPRPGCAQEVEESLERSAAEFLRGWPSLQPLSEEDILRGNRSILASDPAEGEAGTVYPDNTFRRFPLRFEEERYGGRELLRHSLDFFALSSVEALRFAAEHQEKPPARRLPQVLRLLLRQAWGFAADQDELLALLQYAVGMWGGPLAPIVEHADQAFERQREVLLRLFRSEAEMLSESLSSPDGPGSPRAFAAASRRLSWETRAAGAATRLRLATSQMHMSANRLGLTNCEEVHLSRLLWRAALEASGAGGDLARLLERRPASPGAPLPVLLPEAFSEIFGTSSVEPSARRTGAST